MTGAEKLLETARAEIGYLEKASNAQLDDKTANAGHNNWTRYTRDLDALGVYNGKKNGYAWCDMFVDWCFIRTFGLEAGMQLTCQPMGGYGAGCTESARYYRQKGRFVTSGPQPGDQIFFTRDGGGTMYHTGLVEKVAGGRVYTIEGNTSSAAGVVENGGAVRDKSYPLTYAQIGGYGRPDWSLVQGDDEMTEQQIREIIRDELQKAASSRGSLKANAWAAQYIKVCIEAGAMTDVGGGTIERPQDFATREELAKVAAVMAQR